MMIVTRKTLLITSLVLLLVVVTYVNHQLNKQSLLNASNEYQKYEENELSKIESEEDKSVATSTENYVTKASSVSIIDSKDNISNEVSRITDDTNKNIEKNMDNTKTEEVSNYFVEYRLSRDQLRSKLIERLNSIVENQNTTEEVRSLAQKEILRIGNIAENELHIEGLIKGKGFEDAVVFLKEDSARVVVDRNQLTEQDVMKILEVVKNETKLDATNIKIMKKY